MHRFECLSIFTMGRALICSISGPATHQAPNFSPGHPLRLPAEGGGLALTRGR